MENIKMNNLSAKYVCDICGKVLMFDLVNTFVTFTGYFEPPRQLIMASSDCGHIVFTLENYDEYIEQYRKEFILLSEKENMIIFLKK